jgi:hypothetical protein
MFKERVCKTAEGFLVWNLQRHHRCLMQENETITCPMTGTAISCQEIGVSLTDATISVGVEKTIASS